ncbi:hypothetical protein AMECASPLE_038614 [Ameca splendens]|uniref:Uncharacterized protein n=1 Tax=Ameca splendens TaxID=208324 RepID=A0ABV1AFV1_9TELE
MFLSALHTHLLATFTVSVFHVFHWICRLMTLVKIKRFIKPVVTKIIDLVSCSQYGKKDMDNFGNTTVSSKSMNKMLLEERIPGSVLLCSLCVSALFSQTTVGRGRWPLTLSLVLLEVFSC